MKKLLTLILFTVVAVSMMLCGSNASVAAERGTPVIAVVARVIGQPWWDNVRDNGVAKWSQEKGIEVIYKGPTGIDVEEQLQIMTDLVAQGVDIILLCPNDSAAFENICREARENGIIILTHEATGMQNIDYNVEAFDEAGFGGFMMDHLAAMMGYEGEYITMVGDMTTESHNNWADAAIARQEAMYPNMTLVPTRRVTSEYDAEIAYQKTKELLIRYPNLRGVQGTCSFDAPGVARAARELGLAGRLHTIGATLPSEIRDFLHEGVMQTGALWDASITIQAMLNLGMMMYNGETIATGIDLGLPGYDSVTVDGTLITGEGMLAITVDNVDDYSF